MVRGEGEGVTAEFGKDTSHHSESAGRMVPGGLHVRFAAPAGIFGDGGWVVS